MCVTWRGKGACTFHTPNPCASSDSPLQFTLAPHSAANVLVSVEDDELGRLMALTKCSDDEENITNDSERLVGVYESMLEQISFDWTTSGVAHTTRPRSGILQCDPAALLATAKQSSQMWALIRPRPFQIEVNISPSSLQGPSHDALLSARKFYRLSVHLHLQPALANHILYKFTHVEVMIVVLSDTMLRQHDVHSAFSMRHSRVVVNGRRNVKLPLTAPTTNTDLAGGARGLEHAVELCCTRSGTYYVHILARLIRRSDTASPCTALEAPAHSVWWTMETPLACTAK